MCVCILGILSCNTDIDYDVFNDIPAVVGFDYSANQPILITPTEIFIAPELQDYFAYSILVEGEAIFAYFDVEKDQDISEGYRTISNFFYLKTGITKPIDGAEIDKEDFIPIEEMYALAFVIYDRIFFLYAAFDQTAYYRDYIFEMTYDGSLSDGIPTFSIRGKRDGEAYNTIAAYRTPYVFDMYNYMINLEKDSENKVKINLRYKTGVDDEGNEVWKDCKDNPIELKL